VLKNFAISIVEGEPDPSLFLVPSDYREVSPSERESEIAKALGRDSPPANVMERRKWQDQNYFD
jgi:hypothetical protein